PLDQRLHAIRASFRRLAKNVGEQCVCDRLADRHVFQQPVRRPQFRRGEIYGSEPFHWGRCHSGNVLGERFLALLHLDACAFVVLFLSSFIDATINMGYFIMTGGSLENGLKMAPKWLMPAMSIGQIAEIGTMAVLGLVLKRFGWKKTMILGILGHAARFAVYAFFPQFPGLIILVQILHGICYAFFFATVYIFVDEFFPKDARSSAQGLFNFLILGLGPFVGNFVWPLLGVICKADGVIDFHRLFLVPAGVALGAALFLFLAFNPPEKAEANLEAAPAPAH